MKYVEETLIRHVNLCMDTLIETTRRLQAIELEIFIAITKRTENVEETGHYLELYSFDFKSEKDMNRPYVKKSILDMTTNELKNKIAIYSSTIRKVQNRIIELCDILESIDNCGDMSKFGNKIGLRIFIPKEYIRQDILDTFNDDFLYVITTGDILFDHTYMIVSKESVTERSFDSDIIKRDRND